MKEFQTHGMMILTSGSIGSALALTLNNNNNLKGEEEKEEEEEGGKKRPRWNRIFLEPISDPFRVDVGMVMKIY